MSKPIDIHINKMKNNSSQIITQTEQLLGIQFPEKFKKTIQQFKYVEQDLGDESWDFYHLESENYIIESTKLLKEYFKIDLIAFAENGLGDYLLLLPNENNNSEYQDIIYVFWHEIGMIRMFSKSLKSAIKEGGYTYFDDSEGEFTYKVDELGNVIKGNESLEDYEMLIVDGKYYFDKFDKLKSEIDDLIDDCKYKKSDEIIEGLHVLINQHKLNYKTWALNKLSNIYLKGFGKKVNADIEKALYYNQLAMDLGNARAYSNRAACYFMGLGGITIDLPKALEYATKANELSNDNYYEDIVNMINKAISASLGIK